MVWIWNAVKVCIYIYNNVSVCLCVYVYAANASISMYHTNKYNDNFYLWLEYSYWNAFTIMAITLCLTSFQWEMPFARFLCNSMLQWLLLLIDFLSRSRLPMPMLEVLLVICFSHIKPTTLALKENKNNNTNSSSSIGRSFIHFF